MCPVQYISCTDSAPSSLQRELQKQKMTTRRIVCASISLCLGSLFGVVGTASAALETQLQPAIHGSTQPITSHLSSQDNSTPKQGLPGRRVSGGTRNVEVCRGQQTLN